MLTLGKMAVSRKCKIFTSKLLLLWLFSITVTLIEIQGVVVNRSKWKHRYNVSDNTQGSNSKIVLSGPSSFDSNDEITVHPLDPLTAVEIRRAKFMITALRGYVRWQFKWITLKEPSKSSLLQSFLQNTDEIVMLSRAVSRKALIKLVDSDTWEHYEAIVNLSKLTLEKWEKVENAQTSISTEDAITAEDIAFQNNEVLQRVHRLGYDRSTIVCDSWDGSYVPDNTKYSSTRKLIQVYFYGLEGGEDNFYAHPLDFIAYVDLQSKTVSGLVTLPYTSSHASNAGNNNLVPKSKANDHKQVIGSEHSIPASVFSSQAQPNRRNFKLHGNKVTWQNFIFRIGYNGREGVILHHVRTSYKGQVRPVLYRMSLSEILVTHGDPEPPFHRKTSLEMGKFMLGASSTSLPRHTFCLGQSHYLDMVTHDDSGQPIVIKDSICIAEEDAGLLWGHYDRANDRMSATRSQRLSVSSLATLGNADYWISWRFYQDATIELSVKLTGLKNTNLMAIDVKGPFPHGSIVSKNIYSQINQHTFSVRIDADVDSEQNSVLVQDIVPTAAEVGTSRNPFGNGIDQKETLLASVTEARTNVQSRSSRTWKVINPKKINSITGSPTAWKLVPRSEETPLLLNDKSPLRNQSSLRWSDFSMWVLPYNDNQIYASGLWLNRDGLWDWAQDQLSDSLVDKDIVLWHTFSITRTPTIENWPVSSDAQDTAGFILKPDSFFDVNPALAS